MRLRQNGEQVVGRRAATVLTHIDDQSVFASGRRIQLSLKAIEARHIHALNMHISEAVFGRFLHRLLRIVDPLFVEQRTDRTITGRADRHRTRLAFRILHFQLDVAAAVAVQNGCQFHFRINVRSIDRQNHIARFKTTLLARRRAVAYDIANLETWSFEAVVITGSEMRGGVLPLIRRRSGRAASGGEEAKVRSVQLAQHHVDHNAKRRHIDCVPRHRSVLATNLIPVAIVHRFVVPVVSHLSPAQVKDDLVPSRHVDQLSNAKRE